MTDGGSLLRPRRLVYLGTPEMAVPPLRALDDAGFDIALVVSRPDKRRGRGSTLSPSPVKAEAEARGIPVTADIADAVEVGADLGVVVAYGRIIKPPILERLPMVNLHFSLLPRWRGAAPVERAILAGDTETGVCLMEVEEGLDTGGVHRRVTAAIGPEETADELAARLTTLGADLVVEGLEAGLGRPEPQDGTPTYADKIDPAELRLDWTRPAVELHRLVRLGRAWSTFRDRRLKVLEARVEPGPGRDGPGAIVTTGGDVVVTTGADRLRLLRVQPEGKGPIPSVDWRNGARPEPGERLA